MTARTRIWKRQRGGAALVLLLVLSTAAAMIGALAIRGSMTDLRLAGAQRVQKSGFYCAEAGLSAARTYFANNYTLWNTMFDPQQAAPAGYPVVGDLDGDGLNDYSVTLVDNVDEFPPAALNSKKDNDLSAIMVSKCISTTMSAHQLQEIVVTNSRGMAYRDLGGHSSSHNGNAN